MERKEIRVYTKMNNMETNDIFVAIKNENVIKYIDLDNNIMKIDYQNDSITRENKDYIFNIKLNENVIEIFVKKLRLKLNKDIETLLVKKAKKSYMVRYKLIDENEINEYYVNF